jgi:hypothetical protein
VADKLKHAPESVAYYTTDNLGAIKTRAGDDRRAPQGEQ